MTVLFITRKYPPSIGGMQQLSYHLTRAIGRKVSTYVIKWGGRQMWLPFFVIYAFVRALVILAIRPVDIVHIGDPVLAPLGLMLRYLYNLPVVVNAHGLDVIYPSRLYQKVFVGAMRRLDGVICISESTRRRCVERGVRPELTSVIPVGVTVDDFKVGLGEGERRRWASRWRLSRWPARVLLMAGRLVPRKGGVFLVSAVLPLLMERRDDWLCLIVGDGPEREAVERAADEKGLKSRVRVLGRVTTEELRAAYAAADVFVMPNVPVAGDFEGFGLVTLEARASGLPVVASDLEGISDALRDDDGSILVTPGDAASFAQAIDALFSREATTDERLRRRAQVQARYDWSVIADEYLEAFRSALERYGGL